MKIQKQIDTIKRFQEGDTGVFGDLYDEYFEEIYRFVYFRIFHKESAEDVVSLVFLKAFSGLPGFDVGHDNISFRAWLYRIARNAIADYFRTKRDKLDIDNAWNVVSDHDLYSDQLKRDDIKKAGELMRELDNDEQELVIMRIWQDMPFAEIASVLGKNEPAVKMSFYRALKKLRDKI